MWRAALLATLLPLTLSGGALAYPVDLTAIPADKADKHAQGDYDGDGLVDHADFYESADGFLVLIVRLAATPDEPFEIWGGDSASSRYSTVRTAQPGTYRTLCYLYSGCEGRVPSEVTNTHDGIIVREPWRHFYFYWDGFGFRDILIAD